MKKVSIIFLLGISSLVFSQKVSKVSESKSSGDKALLVEADNSKAALEEKKRIAAEEKAKLPKPYDPKADAQKDINNLIAKAQKENKNILLQAGGNWCIWCLRFNQFVQTTPELKEIVDNNYLYYHLNFSPDNKNEKVFAQYDNPGDKFGYPVFIILDKNGKMIHIQRSDVLEQDKGYSKEKVMEFFNNWTPKS
ncbi:thioredoxin family protein [Chryseobacterium sp.]|uniref:thioredoxin family protein n=1 Tax=Chryseobacterium sp. TaxID=1871047 RepID=UPI0025B8A7A3|nr:thioredoxin family protein [Chryseobacterium sp.]